MKQSGGDRVKFRRVEFFKRADGTKPVAEWLNELDDDRAQAVAISIRFFEEYPGPVVPKKFFEKVSEHIWEIKCHYGDEQFRVLAFPDGDTVVIAVVGFAKKAQKLRDEPLKLAERRYREHLTRKKSKRS